MHFAYLFAKKILSFRTEKLKTKQAFTRIILVNKKRKLTTEVVSFVLALPIFPGSRPPSIVVANELNFCVRDGNRWTLSAINTNYLYF